MSISCTNKHIEAVWLNGINIAPEAFPFLVIKIMLEVPEKSENDNELKEIDINYEFGTEEDDEIEHEIRWRWKLRIISMAIIILCSGSIMISIHRRNSLFLSQNESLEYDFTSDNGTDLNFKIPLNSDTDQKSYNLKGNIAYSSGQGEKTVPIENFHAESSKDSETSELENESIIGTFFNNIGSNSEQPVIIEDGHEFEAALGKTEGDEISEVIKTTTIETKISGENSDESTEINTQIINNFNRSMETNEGEIPINLQNEPKKVKRAPKIYEPEFMNLEAYDSDEDVNEIKKPEIYEIPKGRLFFGSFFNPILTVRSMEFIENLYANPEKFEYKIFTGSPTVNSISFAADHKKIAYVIPGLEKESKIVVKDFERMSTLEICGEKGNNCFNPHISPDGTLVIYRKADWKTLYYYNIETGVEAKLDLPPNSIKYSPKFFAESKRFVFTAFTNKKFKIVVSNIFNTQKSKCVYEAEIRPGELAVSPNGRYIAFTLKDFINVVAVNDAERHDKNFKFEMPIPTADDALKIVYYNYDLKKTVTFVDKMPKFSKPFWSPDSMTLFFSCSDSKLYYTGYGLKKWQKCDPSFLPESKKKFYGFMYALPEVKTDEMIKSTIDDTKNINQVG
mgnify:CR=1 FL=1